MQLLLAINPPEHWKCWWLLQQPAETSCRSSSNGNKRRLAAKNKIDVVVYINSKHKS